MPLRLELPAAGGGAAPRERSRVMSHEKNTDETQEFYGPIEVTMSIIGGPHKAVLLDQLGQKKVSRFSDLESRLPYANRKVLVQQLRELETDGVVMRKVYSSVPPRTEYSLTPRGKSMAPVIAAIRAWGIGALGGPLQETVIEVDEADPEAEEFEEYEE